MEPINTDNSNNDTKLFVSVNKSVINIKEILFFTLDDNACYITMRNNHQLCAPASAYSTLVKALQKYNLL